MLVTVLLLSINVCSLPNICEKLKTVEMGTKVR
jgi:hypothetical protein